MTGSVLVAIASLCTTFLLATVGFVFGFGRCKGQLDTNTKDIKTQREEMRTLGASVDGNLGKIERRMETGNRELATLTEAVNTLKTQTAECSSKISSVQLNVANLCGRLEKEV